ncbi:MAG: hypothetical protein K0T99_01010, partial [Alphaproteobacteria bacterium]|nr:hypothetical protein [Alphaproteobacteria bacterium]
VEKTFRDLLYKDRSKVQVGHITNLGLLEVSRQRMKPNFLEANTVICTHCHGKGVVRSHNSNAITVLKTVEGEVHRNAVQVNVFASPDTVLFMLNEKRDAIKKVEEKHSIKILFKQDHKMSEDGFAIEVIEGRSKNYSGGDDRSNSARKSNKNKRGNRDYKKDKNQKEKRVESDKGPVDEVPNKSVKKSSVKGPKKKDKKPVNDAVLDGAGE